MKASEVPEGWYLAEAWPDGKIRKVTSFKGRGWERPIIPSRSVAEMPYLLSAMRRHDMGIPFDSMRGRFCTVAEELRSDSAEQSLVHHPLASVLGGLSIEAVTLGDLPGPIQEARMVWPQHLQTSFRPHPGSPPAGSPLFAAWMSYRSVIVSSQCSESGSGFSGGWEAVQGISRNKGEPRGRCRVYSCRVQGPRKACS